jgi:hypothetical protein
VSYLDWQHAGGDDECAHGYAVGVPCPRCDARQEAEVSDTKQAVADAAKELILRELEGLCDEVRAEGMEVAEQLTGAAAEIAADLARVVVEGADPAKLAELKSQAGLVLEVRRIRLAKVGRKRLESGLATIAKVLGAVLAAGLRGAQGKA